MPLDVGDEPPLWFHMMTSIFMMAIECETRLRRKIFFRFALRRRPNFHPSPCDSCPHRGRQQGGDGEGEKVVEGSDCGDDHDIQYLGSAMWQARDRPRRLLAGSPSRIDWALGATVCDFRLQKGFHVNTLHIFERSGRRIYSFSVRLPWGARGVRKNCGCFLSV